MFLRKNFKEYVFKNDINRLERTGFSQEAISLSLTTGTFTPQYDSKLTHCSVNLPDFCIAI